MTRDIVCKNPFGEEFHITGMTHMSIADFEILLPKEYAIVYAGKEWYTSPLRQPEFDLEFMNNKQFSKFQNRVTIVNLNPNIIKFIPFGSSREHDIELLKYCVANCSSISIYFDAKTKRIDGYNLRYYIEDDGGLTEETIYLFDKDLPQGYFMKDHY